MAEEQQQPQQAPVEQEQASPQEVDFDALLAKKFGGDEPEAAQQPDETPADEVTDQADSDVLTPDDVPDEDAPKQSLPDEIEITYHGKVQKVSRDKALELINQGFDYTQKTQAVAQERERVKQREQYVTQLEAVNQAVFNDAVGIATMRQKLAEFPQNEAEWNQLYDSDPLGYVKKSREQQALIQSIQQGQAVLQQKAQAAMAARAQISAEQLRAEFARAQEMVPEWRDQTRFKQEADEIRAYLRERGYQEAEIDALADSRALVLARDAYQYRKLVKAKAEKVKQARQAPPAIKPGTPTTRSEAKVQEQRDIRQRIARTADKATRDKLVDRLLASKFG